MYKIGLACQNLTREVSKRRALLTGLRLCWCGEEQLSRWFASTATLSKIKDVRDQDEATYQN